MNETKHTPGPWKVRQCEHHLTKIKHWSVEDATTVVAELEAWDYPDCDESKAEANAHLIAAAPELLEALKAVVALGIEDEAIVWLKAITAIAKAESS